MSKTVGIVTVHDIYNYGSILQAFATQHAVEQFGFDAQIIDYQYPNPRHNKSTAVQRLKAGILRCGNSVLKDLLPGRPNTTYKRRYRKFKNDHYHLSAKRYPTAESLISDPPAYDIYLAGSDQIWRPKFVKDDPCFFLDFAKTGRKISYASSFGCLSIAPEYRDAYRKYLSGFSHLGVRETPGRDIIKELTGRDATVVLDPTLLMDKDQWAAYSVPFKSDKPYIVCYGYGKDKFVENLAEHISRLTGYKIIRINGKFYDYFNRKIRYILDAGPAEWMGLLANAAFVIGQSFHATAYAINFQRPFFSILDGTPDGESRQRHILKLLGLEDRAMQRGSPLPELKDLRLDIDFQRAISRLQAEREKSLAYLKSALENN